ncbi:MAG: amidohydrolase [Mycobacteriaceae bacterium]
MSTQLLLSGRIYSSTSADATAMAITDGTVVWVGADGPGRALYPTAEVIDLDGRFVSPGIVDTHVHCTSAGLALQGLDLSGNRTLSQCLEQVRRYAAANPEGVVWGHGWDESQWVGQRIPTRAELDACAPGRAIYLSRVDVHSALVSSPLIARAPGVRDADGWSPDGPLSRQAHHLVRDAARTGLAPGQRAAARRAFLDDAASHGVVCVHECGGAEISGLRDFQETLAEQHGVELHGYWGQAVATATEAADLLSLTGAHGLAGDIFVDGSLGSRTAWLHQPYCDDPSTTDNTGAAYLQVPEVAAHLRACTEVGVQAGFHVIGDAAVQVVVEAFADVVAELGGPRVAACGHRLEHVEMITTAQAALLGSWGVLASVQPLFDALWGGTDGLYAQRLGPERGSRLNPYAAMAARGVSLAFGSDAPVTPIDPWRAVQAAVHHRTPGSGISPRAAFGAATRGAWRAGGVRDGVAGTLAPGAPASYAVWDCPELVVAAPRDAVQRWSTDPRAGVAGLPPLDPGSALPQCVRTVHRGQTIFRR